jgi:hypothetical protein
MLNDIVNTITFDFTCKTEIAAKSMRNEFINYKAYQISSILSEVLSEKIDKDTLWKINKLEIDLGNIRLEDIGTDYILHVFKDVLSVKIDESRNSLYGASNTNEVIPQNLHLYKDRESGANGLTYENPHLHRQSRANTIALSTAGAQIGIIKELLLYGDLPWWIDKNNFTGINNIFKIVITQKKEDLVFFLDAQKNNPDVIRRIRLFCSPRTISLLNSIVPGITNIAFIDPFSLDDEKVYLEKLSNPVLQKIGDSLNKRISAGNQNLKLMLIRRLLGNEHEYLLHDIKHLGILTGNEIKALELFFRDNRAGKIESENAVQILQRLNIFQLEFLSHPALLKAKQAESLALTNNTKPGNDKARARELESKKKIVSYIANKIKAKNPLLADELFNAPEQDLRDLQKLFKQYKKHSAFKKKLISLIVEHPYFLKYKLLSLFANLSFESTDDTSLQLKASKLDFQKVTRDLTINEKLILTEVFSAGTFPSASAKNTVIRVLNRLPDKSLLLISELIHLNKKEIENLVPVQSASSAASTELNKTIINNAGLCLLAAYLPAFFNHLGFTENGKFKTRAGTHRALYLLEYIVNGRQRNYEYVLQLNKLLCGLKINEPITGYKRLTVVERNEAEDLITSVINHWKVLKSTSQKGFRSSFLQRKGILTEQENSWILQVERKGYDLLLDSIPWSFNMIKFPWMNKMIRVEW